MSIFGSSHDCTDFFGVWKKRRPSLSPLCMFWVLIFCNYQACFQSAGDVNDVADVSVCANRPAFIEPEFANTEYPCIFPFYLNGEFHNACIQLSQDDFIYPVNICPIRNITTKTSDGINSYTYEDLNEILVFFRRCF